MLRALEGPRSKLGAQCIVAKKLKDAICNGIGVLRFEEQATVTHHLGQTSTAAAGKHRDATGHGLYGRKPESLPERREDECIGGI